MTTNNSAWSPILTALIISVVDPNNKFSNLGNKALPISTEINLNEFVFGALATAQRNDIKMPIAINEDGEEWMWADFFVERDQSKFRAFNFAQVIELQMMSDEKEKQSEIANYVQFVSQMPISKFGALICNDKWTQDSLTVLFEVCTNETIKKKLKQRIDDTKLYYNSIMGEYDPTATPGNDSNFDGSAALKEASVESSMS